MSDTEKSPEEEEGSARSPASSDDDDMARPHVYATVWGCPPAPPLPARRRGSVGGSDGRQRKARARSPVNEDTSRTGEDIQTSSDAAPALPPRVPLYLCPSTGRILRVSSRPVLYPRPPVEVPTAPCTLNPQLSASDILRSRPPPPPSRDAIPNISFSPTEKPFAFVSSDVVDRISLSSLNASRGDPDLVWWPSEEQRSQLSNQVLQLTHWPIPSLPPSTEVVDASTNRPRRMNDYVDGPVASLQSNARSTTLDGLQRTHVPQDSQMVQPASSSLSRHPAPQNPEISVPKAKTSESDSPTTCRQSILCSRCGKCRCKQCTESRPLPRVWLGERECSAQAAVDCTTCMCVARALFYHCRSAEETDYSDDPCACTEQRDCCKRWTALSLLSLCLPCLCLYWPLKGALRLCTACYNRRHGRGCRCPTEMPTSDSKGLLLESESSSSS